MSCFVKPLVGFVDSVYMKKIHFITKKTCLLILYIKLLNYSRVKLFKMLVGFYMWILLFLKIQDCFIEIDAPYTATRCQMNVNITERKTNKN